MEIFLSIIIVIAFGWFIYSRYSKKKKVEKAKKEAKSAEEKAIAEERKAQQKAKQAAQRVAQREARREAQVHSFSVSENRKVKFSHGNLQFQPSTDTWRFAENQFDIIGDIDTKEISPLYSRWMDKFGWGTGDNPTNVCEISEYYDTFVDWGKNKIGDYPENTWRTLSDVEWFYLIFMRTNAAKLVGLGEVNCQLGLIILPDDWTIPTNMKFIPLIKSGMMPAKTNFSEVINTYMETEEDVYYHCIYSIEEWQIMEKNGAIFLPYPLLYWSNSVFSDKDFSDELGDKMANGLVHVECIGIKVGPWERKCRLSVRLVRNV